MVIASVIGGRALGSAASSSGEASVDSSRFDRVSGGATVDRGTGVRFKMMWTHSYALAFGTSKKLEK